MCSNSIVCCALAAIAVPALAQASSDEVRAIVAEMMADAQTRSSLLSAGGDAGYDEAFFIESADGSFRLDINGQVEFRYTASFADDAPRDDDFEGGFTLPTAELAFSGHAVTPSLVFNIEAEFEGDNGGAFVLTEAYAGHEWDSGWGVYGGQAQLPLLWEDIVDGETALAVDLSVLNGVFNPGDAQGVWLAYTGEAFRGWYVFSDGIESENSEFNDSPADYAFTTRNEFLFAGEWDDFELMSSMPGSEFGAKLGLAAHWQDGPNRPGADEAAVLPYTVDLQIKGDGWNLFAAYIGRYLDDDADGASFHDAGLLVQGGVFVPETDVELFARYDAVLPDTDRAGDDAFSTITAGVNWFWHGSAARFSFDVQYFVDDTTGNDLVDDYATNDGTEIGLLPSGDEGQVTLRAQMTITF